MAASLTGDMQGPQLNQKPTKQDNCTRNHSNWGLGLSICIVCLGLGLGLLLSNWNQGCLVRFRVCCGAAANGVLWEASYCMHGSVQSLRCGAVVGEGCASQAHHPSPFQLAFMWVASFLRDSYHSISFLITLKSFS